MVNQAQMSDDDSGSLPHVESYQDGQGKVVIVLNGYWNSHTVNLVDKDMRGFETLTVKALTIDISAIQSLDTAGAWLISRLRYHLATAGITVDVKGMRESWKPLLETVFRDAKELDREAHMEKVSAVFRSLDKLGRKVSCGFFDFIIAMHILGSTIRGGRTKKGHTAGISMPALFTQMDRMGVGAVPIIILMSFIVGAIIAQQGAFQLRYFGAEIFVVDLVGILVFRELGVLLTAIMIAGRSGSAITAEIGAMKMREETDALKVIGLDPIGVLVFPRLVALAIVLPILTVVSDLSALVGAATVAKFYSGIPYEAFIGRLKDAVYLTTYFAGLIKAPFMALIIGIIASVEGLKVGGSAESLGQRVTSSVVKSIFVVIVIDGFFAIFYASINF